MVNIDLEVKIIRRVTVPAPALEPSPSSTGSKTCHDGWGTILDVRPVRQRRCPSCCTHCSASHCSRCGFVCCRCSGICNCCHTTTTFYPVPWKGITVNQTTTTSGLPRTKNTKKLTVHKSAKLPNGINVSLVSQTVRLTVNR